MNTHWHLRKESSKNIQRIAKSAAFFYLPSLIITQKIATFGNSCCWHYTQKIFCIGRQVEKGYSKKIFTARMFFSDFVFLIWHSPQLITVFTNKKIEKLIGKIFIVTDAVNECMYCSWLDAKLAIKNGISEKEVKNMMNLEFQTIVSDYELPALIFAQNFAENNRKTDVEMLQTLTLHYGEKTTKDILLAIRAVNFGNLYFNTWGAFLSRLKGRPAPNSNLMFEIIYFLCNFVIIIPFVVLGKLDRNAIGLGGKNEN